MAELRKIVIGTAQVEGHVSWNYRIVVYQDDQGYGLHEVFYDDDGTPNSMSADPADFVCDTDEGPDGIIKSLERALADVKRLPLFPAPAHWKDSK